MDEPVYCDFQAFANNYEQIHGPVSLFVCFFGSIANVLNICVLTTKEMRSPTNLILTGLAVADLLVMLEYIPFTYNRYIDVDKKLYSHFFSYEWAVFTKFHAIFSQVFHFSSCCLTVILAIWRYLALTNPSSGKFWCEWRKTLIVIIMTYFGCTLICCPLFISYAVLSINQTCDDKDKILYSEDLLNFTGETHTEILYITNYVSENYKTLCFWIYSVVMKLVPCILLTHLSIRLITVLFKTKKHRKKLMNPNMHLQTIKERKPMISKKVDKDKQADRTSAMLVAVLLLFLLTEFPQAILGLLSATKGERFEVQCYIALGESSFSNILFNFAYVQLKYLVIKYKKLPYYQSTNGKVVSL